MKAGLKTNSVYRRGEDMYLAEPKATDHQDFYIRGEAALKWKVGEGSPKGLT
jgi:hypothetical protein